MARTGMVIVISRCKRPHFILQVKNIVAYTKKCPGHTWNVNDNLIYALHCNYIVPQVGFATFSTTEGGESSVLTWVKKSARIYRS